MNNISNNLKLPKPNKYYLKEHIINTLKSKNYFRGQSRIEHDNKLNQGKINTEQRKQNNWKKRILKIRYDYEIGDYREMIERKEEDQIRSHFAVTVH